MELSRGRVVKRSSRPLNAELSSYQVVKISSHHPDRPRPLDFSTT